MSVQPVGSFSELLESQFNTLNNSTANLQEGFNEALSTMNAQRTGNPQQDAFIDSSMKLVGTQFYAINKGLHLGVEFTKVSITAGALPSAFKTLIT